MNGFLIDTNVISEFVKPKPLSGYYRQTVHNCRCSNKPIGDFVTSGVAIVNPWEL